MQANVNKYIYSLTYAHLLEMEMIESCSLLVMDIYIELVYVAS